MAEAAQEHEATPPKSIASKSFNALQLSWKYKHLVPTVLTTVLWHYTLGPPHPSWPLETALFSAVAHKVSSSAPKPDPNKKRDPVKAMQAARKMFAIEKWLPPLKNGVAWSVEVPVKKRGLGGILEEFDQKEDGKRTLDADWVVHRDVLETASPRVVLYFHGGGYIIMSKESHRPVTVNVSKAAHCRVFTVNYRLAPESPFPGGLHDAVSSYLYLTEDLGIPAGNIYVAGDSAGGGLSMALLLYLRDMKMPRLGGAILLSPWCDLTTSLGSWEENVKYDYLSEREDKTMDPVHLYLGGNFDRYLTHPYVTSCIAPLSSLPPLLIQAGGAEVLRDESTLLAQRAAIAGVEVTHEILDGGLHVAQAFIKTEISRTAFVAIEQWIGRQKVPDGCESFDGEIDKELRERIGKLPEGKEVERVVKQPYTFVADVQDPPEVKLRKTANEEVRRAVEEVNKVEKEERKKISSLYVATKTPPDHLLAKIWGRLHL